MGQHVVGEEFDIGSVHHPGEPELDHVESEPDGFLDSIAQLRRVAGECQPLALDGIARPAPCRGPVAVPISRSPGGTANPNSMSSMGGSRVALQLHASCPVWLTLGAMIKDTDGVAVAAESRLDRVGWSALRYPPFRLFFVSMVALSSGSFVYFAALGWYVLELTGSPAAVGFAFTAYGIAGLLLTAHAGVVTDRFGSRPMLLISLVAMAAFSGGQAVVAFVGGPPYWLVIALAFGLGLAQTIGAPASVAIVGDLVPPPAVSSAVTLNFLHMNAARIVGGVVAGSLLAAATPAFGFAAAALLAAVPAVVLSRLPSAGGPEAGRERPRAALVGPLVEAFRYATMHPTLGVLIVLAIAPGAIGLSYIFMLPVAAQELGIGPAGLGALLVASGCGGLLAGVSLEVVHRRIGHGRGLIAGLAGASGSMIVFGVVPGVPLALLALAVVGGSILTYASSSVTLINALAPPRLRGRLVSLFAMFYWGMLPVGSLITGLVAEATTARMTVLLCGIALGLVGGLALVVRPQLATLAVARDGRTLLGDLRGSGAE